MIPDTQPAVLELGHGISCIDTLQVRPGLACCYLIERQGELAFIEAGTAVGVPALLQLLADRGYEREQVRYVIPTHVHLDHAGGAGLLMQELPAATLVVHPRGARHMIDPGKLIAGATAVYGADAMQAMYGQILPVPAARVLEAPEGLELALGDSSLKFIDTPGHARHHFCVWDAHSAGMFTGDTFGLSYRELDGPWGAFLMPTTTPVQFDPQAWEDSLQRMLALQPERMYLTHYAMVESVPKLAEDLRAGLRRYVAIAEAAPASKRHQALREALAADAIEQLRLAGSAMDEKQIRQIIQFDIELNAQGLGVWLDRH